MIRRGLALAALTVFTALSFGCGHKEDEKANPVPANDSQFASPKVQTAPGPGGSGGASAPGAANTQ